MKTCRRGEFKNGVSLSVHRQHTNAVWRLLVDPILVKVNYRVEYPIMRELRVYNLYRRIKHYEAWR
jgi:hypothetical protein